MKYKLLSIVMAFLFIVGLMPPVSAEAKVYTMKDVDESDEAYESIQNVLDQGWMELVLGKFYPDKYITRGEFTYIITKFCGQLGEAKSINEVTFKDVSLDNQYGRFIELQKKYITYYKRTNGNYFKPKNYLTREDALVTIVKILGYTSEDSFEEGAISEVDIDEIIEDADKITPALINLVTLGVTNKLIDLIEDGDYTYLEPKKSITRRQMAQLLVNAKQYDRGSDTDDLSTDGADDSTEELVTDSDSSSDKTSGNKNQTSNNSGNSGNNSGNSSGSKSGNNKSSSTVNNELGYLKVNLNGREMLYKQKTTGNLGSYFDFYNDKYSTNNSFYIQLPTDIAAGDSITIDSATDSLFYPMSVQYTNASGENFVFGYPLGNFDGGKHKSSKATVTITEYTGKGGYVSGTIEAELIFSDETITFSGGEFRFKLNQSSF